MAFDSAVWRESPGELKVQSIRFRMVDDLLESRRLDGKNRSEVVDLIGEPDHAFRPEAVGERMEYLIGLWGVDGMWLVVELDEAGVVVDAYQRQD